MAFLDLKIVLVAFVWLVDEIKCHCRCLKPLSTITNRPNGIRFRKFTHKSLNKWIAGIASLCAINKSQNWRFSRVRLFWRESLGHRRQILSWFGCLRFS